MPRVLTALLVFCLSIVSLSAQPSSESNAPVRIGPGVTPPRLIRKVEPEYSAEARANQIQGTVMFQIVVSEQGRPTEITVLSPLGFGLDEQAQRALEQWEFAPGMKNGVPVRILANVEVNFRFAGVWFDEKAERRRNTFNLALGTLGRSDSASGEIARAVASITELSRSQYPPAVYLAGKWLLDGEHGQRDTAAGLAKMEEAAAKNYGPALYEVGIRRVRGHELPHDLKKGLSELRSAATLGSVQAQYHLGVRYETGDGVPGDQARARRYYHLCASRGTALCQYRLGRLLLEAAGRNEREYVQAQAWLQLAAEQDLAEAKALALKDAPQLTAEQRAWVETLKRQMMRK